jgi:hypothetical protein
MAMLPKTKLNSTNEQNNNRGNGVEAMQKKVVTKQANPLSLEKKRNQSLTQQHSGTDILKL